MVLSLNAQQATHNRRKERRRERNEKDCVKREKKNQFFQLLAPCDFNIYKKVVTFDVTGFSYRSKTSFPSYCLLYAPPHVFVSREKQTRNFILDFRRYFYCVRLSFFLCFNILNFRVRSVYTNLYPQFRCSRIGSRIVIEVPPFPIYLIKFSKGYGTFLKTSDLQSDI